MAYVPWPTGRPTSAALVLALSLLVLLAGPVASGLAEDGQAGAPALKLEGALPRGLSYRSSDAAGFPGPSCDGPESAPFVVGLTPDFEAGSGARVLFEKGVEVERILRTRSGGKVSEQVYRLGLLAETRILSASGNLETEAFYTAPEGPGLPSLAQRRTYTYKGGRLVTLTASGPDGKPLGEIDYRYDPVGRLVEAVATGSFGSSRSGLLVGPQGLAATYLARGGSEEEGSYEVTSYGPDGQALRTETYGEAGLLGTTVTARAPDGTMSSRTAEDLASRRKTVTTFDGAGRPLLEVETINGAAKSRRTYAYDEQGRLLQDSLAEGTGTTSTSYVYDTGEDLSAATYRENGVLVRVVRTRAGGLVLREYYDGTLMVLRAIYRDGRLAREEFYGPAGLLRAKDYPQ